MMEAIASAAMNMQAAQLSVNYSMAIERKVMDTQEMAAQELLQMLPDIPRGQLIDTYACAVPLRLWLLPPQERAGESHAAFFCAPGKNDMFFIGRWY